MKRTNLDYYLKNESKWDLVLHHRVSYAPKLYCGTFLIPWTYSFSVEFILVGLYFSVLLLLFIQFVKFFDVHKMGLIVQKWSTIPIHMSKFYQIECCKAFLAVTSYFKSNFLYSYYYFCGLRHSKSHSFSCQLTKINFGVPIQKYVSLILKMQILL